MAATHDVNQAGAEWQCNTTGPQSQPVSFMDHGWPEDYAGSASTTPIASTSVAAVRWLGLLTSHTSPQTFETNEPPPAIDRDSLDSLDNQDGNNLTALQQATQAIDGQLTSEDLSLETFWQASENIALLDDEQYLFENFLHKICPWVGRSAASIVHRC